MQTVAGSIGSRSLGACPEVGHTVMHMLRREGLILFPELGAAHPVIDSFSDTWEWVKTSTLQPVQRLHVSVTNFTRMKMVFREFIHFEDPNKSEGLVARLFQSAIIAHPGQCNDIAYAIVDRLPETLNNLTAHVRDFFRLEVRDREWELENNLLKNTELSAKGTRWKKWNEL